MVFNTIFGSSVVRTMKLHPTVVQIFGLCFTNYIAVIRCVARAVVVAFHGVSVVLDHGN